MLFDFSNGENLKMKRVDLQEPISPTRFTSPLNSPRISREGTVEVTSRFVTECLKQNSSAYRKLNHLMNRQEGKPDLFNLIQDLHQAFFKTLVREKIFPQDEIYSKASGGDEIQIQMNYLKECNEYSSALKNRRDLNEKYSKFLEKWDQFNIQCLRKPDQAIKLIQSIISALNVITKREQLEKAIKGEKLSVYDSLLSGEKKIDSQ